MSDWDLARTKVLHVSVGPGCNNRCAFCMEYGEGLPERFTLEQIGSQLDRAQGITDGVIFTSGEPTLNPLLADAIRAARDRGFTHIGLITNGRRLSSRELTLSLLEAGLNEVTVSLHGPTAEVHDAITRREGAFAETVQGLATLAELRTAHPFRLRVNCTLVRANLAHLAALFELTSRHGVDTLNFNTVEPRGRAADDFDDVVPRYADVLQAADESGLDFYSEAVSLSRVPPCAGGPEWIQEDFHFTHTEEVTHFDPDEGMAKGQPCEECWLNARCHGVPDRYVEAFGWTELRPVRPERPEDPPLRVALRGDAAPAPGQQLRSGFLEGYRRVVLTGVDPLANEQLSGTIRLARNLGFRHVEVETSGRSLTSSKQVEKLLAPAPDRITVRLRSVEPATHDAAVGDPGAYEQSLRAAKLLARQGAPLNLRVTLGVDRAREAETARQLGRILNAHVTLE
ncbi:MAG: radical SAM protein [bacterium]